MRRIALFSLRPGRVTALLAAAATVAAVTSPTAGSWAQTAGPGGSDPTAPQVVPAPQGPPAPASFADDLIRGYQQINTLPPPPGVQYTPQATAADFDQVVRTMSPEQLNRLYDQNPAGWDQILRTAASYGQAVAPVAATAVAAPPPPAPPAAPSAEGSTDEPPEPVRYEKIACPTLDFVTKGGAYQELYSLNVARAQAESIATSLDAFGVAQEKTASEAAGKLLDAAVVGGFVIAAAALGPVEAAETTATVLESIAFVADVFADAMAVGIDTLKFLVDRSVESCEFTNANAEIQFTDANAVKVETNVNTIFGLGQQNQQRARAISQLLDTRTQTIVNQLNGAQASLDQALHHSIEEALAGGNTTAIVSYELPTSLGGYLDATPIGVQAIVTSTLSMMQMAKQPIAPSAAKDLAQANNLLIAAKYKDAFAMYQTTYNLLVRSDSKP